MFWLANIITKNSCKPWSLRYSTTSPLSINVTKDTKLFSSIPETALSRTGSSLSVPSHRVLKASLPRLTYQRCGLPLLTLPPQCLVVIRFQGSIREHIYIYTFITCSKLSETHILKIFRVSYCGLSGYDTMLPGRWWVHCFHIQGRRWMRYNPPKCSNPLPDIIILKITLWTFTAVNNSNLTTS